MARIGRAKTKRFRGQIPPLQSHNAYDPIRNDAVEQKVKKKRTEDGLRRRFVLHLCRFVLTSKQKNCVLFFAVLIVVKIALRIHSFNAQSNRRRIR